MENILDPEFVNVFALPERKNTIPKNNFIITNSSDKQKLHQEIKYLDPNPFLWPRFLLC